jgi:archaellum component FlaC
MKGEKHMSKITVNFCEMRECVEKSKNTIAKLNAFSDQINAVNKQMENISNCGDGIKTNLQAIAKQVQTVEATMSNTQIRLENIIKLYYLTETDLCDKGRENASLNASYEDYDKNTNTFDDDDHNGSYGADQGNMAHHRTGVDFLWWHLFEDEDLYAYVRQHSRYQDYSEKDIAKLLEQINKEGCGYAAMVNNIFVAYEGREKEFEQVFGFPMYDKDGKANYDYLLVDIYANTDDYYFLDSDYGATAYVNRYINVLEDINGAEAFKKLYGVDLYDEFGNVSDEARQVILDENFDGNPGRRLQAMLGNDVSDTASLVSNGNNPYEWVNRFDKYLEQNGIDSDVEIITDRSLSGEQISQYMDSGKSINIGIGSEGINLYNVNGKVDQKVDSHLMTITGVAENGDYIVSSWGKRYYIKPSEFGDEPVYLVTDISK